MGIDLQPRIKQSLYEVSTSLMNEIKDARWVAKDNIHLTLKFLGSTPDERLDEITAAIERSVKDFRKFCFSLGQLGGFPGTKKARVLWVGVQHGGAELAEISKALDKELAPLGYEPEKKAFKPHITLARIKDPVSIEEQISRAQPSAFQGRLVNVDGITLFRSHLKRSGAEYEALEFTPLPG